MKCDECPAMMENGEFFWCLINAPCKKSKEGYFGCRYTLKTINKRLDEMADDISIEINERFDIC